MNKKIIGILICTLLIANVSAVLGVPEEKITSNENTESFVIVNPFGQEDVKYVVCNTDVESETPRGNVVGTYENLAPNPSFEEGDTFPTGWTYSSSSKGIFHWDSDYAHSGEKSIGILNLTKPVVWINWETRAYIPVDFKNNSYEFSAWYKYLGQPAANQFAALDIAFYDEKHDRIIGYYHTLSFSSEWKHGSMSSSTIDPDVLNMSKYVKLELVQADFKEEEVSNALLEIRFDDVFFGTFTNVPPNKPTITGKISGAIQTSYDYTVQTTDPDQDDVGYYIDWGDGTTTVTGYNESGSAVIVSHIWNTKGTYPVGVVAFDQHGAISEVAALIVIMPYSYNTQIPQFLELLFQRFPNAFPLLRQLMGY